MDVGICLANIAAAGVGTTGVPADANCKIDGWLSGVGNDQVHVVGPSAPLDQTGTFGIAFPDPRNRDHYGWARAPVEFNVAAGTSAATLFDWAYENQPNTPIRTALHEPSALSLLALLATGLAPLRARHSKA